MEKSDIMVDQLRTIDNRCFIKRVGAIGTATQKRLTEIFKSSSPEQGCLPFRILSPELRALPPWLAPEIADSQAPLPQRQESAVAISHPLK
ncbi:MAG: hypothetical protein FJ117_04635 [Deltaproteobacteria bacterium]|nr:hypothetical protein [Deltaproteobacteria bacterium]